MIDSSYYIKFLECNSYFREHIDTFIEAFVKYYGEDKRKDIEYKFKNNLLVAYQNPINERILINKAKQDKTQELIKLIINNNKCGLESDDLFGYTNSYQHKNNMPIDQYSIFYNIYKYKKNGNREELLNNNYIHAKNIVPSLTKEEFLEMINKKELIDKCKELEYFDKLNLVNLLDLDKMDEIYEKNKKRIIPLLNKLNSNITIDNVEEYLDKDENIINLNYMTEVYMKTLDEYSKFNQDFIKYEEELKETTILKKRIEDELYKELLKDNIDLIPIDKREGYEDFINGKVDSYSLGKEIRNIIGSSLLAKGLITAFDDESDKLLETKDKSDWRVKSIIEDRMNYFNYLGINLGDNYDDYINNEEVKKIWPNKKRITKFKESIDKLVNELNNRFFMETDFYKKTKKEIEEKHLLDRLDSIDARLYTSSSNTFVSPNLIKTENGYETSSIVVINMDTFDDRFRDHYIVHELNHLFELTLESAGERHYTTLCGWDISDEEIVEQKVEQVDTMTEDDDKRNYELFNEIINELIAQEISKIMKDNGMGVFDDPKTSKFRGSTSYEYSLFLVKEFYEEFKDKIIESRRDGNINIILDEVGKDNFEDLNHLFQVFYENYSGFKIYKALDDVRKSRMTENSKVYYELIDKKNEIIERMRKRKQEKSIETTI